MPCSRRPIFAYGPYDIAEYTRMQESISSMQKSSILWGYLTARQMIKIIGSKDNWMELEDNTRISLLRVIWYNLYQTSDPYCFVLDHDHFDFDMIFFSKYNDILRRPLGCTVFDSIMNNSGKTFIHIFHNMVQHYHCLMRIVLRYYALK